MASLTTLKADLVSAEAKLKALEDKFDVEVETGGQGGKVRIQRGGQIAVIEKRIYRLRMEIASKSGRSSLEPARPGVDVDRLNDNADI